MKNNKIVKYIKNGKYYYIFAYFENLYMCYELCGYLPKDSNAEGKQNILTNVIRQYFFDKEDLQYLTKKEIYILNNTFTKYQANFHQFNDEFEEEYENNDTYGGQLKYLEQENQLWCRMIKEY